MPVSDSDIRDLIPRETIKRVSVGDSLNIVMEPARKGGGKSFYGYIYFSPGGGGKRVQVCIGRYGKGSGKWSLKQARDEWVRIRAWSLETGRDPRELKKKEAAKKLDFEEAANLRDRVKQLRQKMAGIGS